MHNLKKDKSFIKNLRVMEYFKGFPTIKKRSAKVIVYVGECGGGGGYLQNVLGQCVQTVIKIARTV